MKRSGENMKSKFNIIRIPLILINLIISIYMIISINKLNVIPMKYFIIGIGILAVINILLIILLLLKNIIFKIIGVILSIILIAASLFGLPYINNTNDFLDKSFNNIQKEISTYNLIVLNSSNYTSKEELENKKIGYLTETNDALAKLNEAIKTENEEYEDIFELYDALLDKKVEAILMDESIIDVIADEKRDIEKNIKVLYSFDLETIIEKEKKEEEKVLRPINIYISGSDSRSNNIQNKSRSDVNMVVTINPNTNEILLTSIPRDYYVLVHGQTGLKDKLTHSGIYGLDVSAATIEDLFDIKIDYSIKLGFNAVEEVVDLVGGIDVESDITFNSYHIKGWVVKKGINHFDGKQALAYARERYAYASGDRHRIQNQQQVLEATMKKVLSNKSLLLKYDSLLNSLGNLYRTDIPREVITEYVKKQLNDGKSWTFTSQWVDGKGASLNTHTAPQYKRYVMIPYEEDVEEASAKIKELIEKK